MSNNPADAYDAPDSPGAGGYLKTKVEEHKPYSNCRYPKTDGDPVRVNACVGYTDLPTYILTRDCSCGNYNKGDPDIHYRSDCKWKKVVDAYSNKRYFIRKCFCQKPIGY